ncbi:hypothetical protein [Thiocapsa bogorovii]|uniref:hypothetical protein n=1 Tax=Thiocapsa bogorovii TaxID=521689 RepID=UPI001E3F62FC|nr:hypothetical protein [Thiocapsa bogorovii]UHD16372.1 hypothetical protein LT988_24545 [Thiocapsa bogorovii]
MHKQRAITWLPSLIALAALSAGPAAADRSDELIARAERAIAQVKQAKADGDSIGLQQAVSDAQQALAAIPEAGAELDGNRAATANASGQSTAAVAAADRSSPEPESEPKPEEPKSVFKKLSDHGFRMQREFGTSGPAAEAATFAFEQDVAAGTQTDLSANFLIGWNSAAVKRSGIDPLTGEPRTVTSGSSSFDGRSDLTWYWDTSVQGKLTSGEDTALDSWRFRIGLDADHTSGWLIDESLDAAVVFQGVRDRGGTKQDAAQAVRAHQQRVRERGAKRGLYLGSWWSIAAKLEADRDFDNQRLGVELLTTPTTSLPGNGIIYPRSRNAAAQFIWRPYLGIDAAGVVASNGDLDDVNDTLRFEGRLDAMLRLNFLAEALGLPNVELSASDQVRYLAESGDAYNYLSSQFRFGLAEGVSFALTYVNGEDAPSFEREERFGGSLAVKF